MTTCRRCNEVIAEGDPHVRAGELVVCLTCLSIDERRRLLAGRSKKSAKPSAAAAKSAARAGRAPTAVPPKTPVAPAPAESPATRVAPASVDPPPTPTPKVPHRHGSLVIESRDGRTLNDPLPLEAAPTHDTLETKLVPCDVCGRRMAAAHDVCADCGYDRRKGIHTSALVELGGVTADELACEDCGYLLRGITSARCPECGAAIGRRRRRLGRDDTAYHIDETKGMVLTAVILVAAAIGVGMAIDGAGGAILVLIAFVGLTAIAFIAALVIGVLGGPIDGPVGDIAVSCLAAAGIGVGVEFIVPCLPFVGAVAFGIAAEKQFEIGFRWAFMYTLMCWGSLLVGFVAMEGLLGP
ncbi:MAG: hypothetical protein AB8G96_13560 [Phycisphaerales bacterium]